MTMIKPDEQDRLDALIERFALEPYRDTILAQGAPCIAMALDDPPEERPEVWPDAPLGASKVGGMPDLPSQWRWPVRDGQRAGFFLQIALADVPHAAWNPLPAHGMLYLFCWTDSAAFWDPPGWELLWWDGPCEALARSTCPREPLDPEIDHGFFESSDPRVIKLRIGTDFPPGSQSDWDFVNELRDIGCSRRDDDVLERYFDFTELAVDPEVEIDRAKGRGRFFYPVGRLFGHTDRSLRHNLVLAERAEPRHFSDWTYRSQHAAELDRAGAAWRQIMRLESNPATTYMSPCDAAPIYVMANDPGTRPWVPLGGVHGLAAK